MFKPLLGWSLKISYNSNHLISVWLLHCKSGPRQSAQSGPLSLQLHLLKSFINILGQLILSAGFKPHWHADESPIEWQAWRPSTAEWAYPPRNDGTVAPEPRGALPRVSLCSYPSLLWGQGLSQSVSEDAQFPEHASLNPLKYETSEKDLKKSVP